MNLSVISNQHVQFLILVFFKLSTQNIKLVFQNNNTVAGLTNYSQ